MRAERNPVATGQYAEVKYDYVRSSDSAEKPHHSPFDKLRTNRGFIEIMSLFPFMLSLSKHERPVFQRNHILTSDS